MKKIPTMLLMATLLFCSCSSAKFALGMSEDEFVKKNRSVELVETSFERTVYKRTTQPFGKPEKVNYFYFIGGKLVQMDGGVARPDVIIENKY